MDAYRHYKNGMFAVQAGFSEQPVKYLEGIGIVDSEIAAIEKEKLDGAR